MLPGQHPSIIPAPSFSKAGRGNTEEGFIPLCSKSPPCHCIFCWGPQPRLAQIPPTRKPSCGVAQPTVLLLCREHCCVPVATFILSFSPEACKSRPPPEATCFARCQLNSDPPMGLNLESRFSVYTEDLRLRSSWSAAKQAGLLQGLGRHLGARGGKTGCSLGG